MYTSIRTRNNGTKRLADISEISAAERAYREIRNRIVSLELKPNKAISETFLSGELNMSRTPVREALTRLSGEGLVDFRARAGTIVSPIRLEAVRTAQFVREKLELSIIQEAARNHSSHALFNIRQTIEQQRFAISEGDIALFFSADEQMHRHFSEMVGRAAVWAHISEAKKHMDRVRRLSLEDIDLEILLDDHEKILAAITDGDETNAQAVMMIHLRRAMDSIDNLIKQNNAYFEPEKNDRAAQAQHDLDSANGS